jgi:hypothetical protein
VKLWHVAQWGNPKDGPDGWDTQCIVAAPNMQAAIQFGQERFRDQNGEYRDNKADTIYHMGDDGRPDGEPRLVTRVYVDVAMNLGGYPAWHRKWDTDEWLDTATMYGWEAAKV